MPRRVGSVMGLRDSDDFAPQGAGGDLQLAGERGSGQPAALAQQQDQ
jgi:hypothetical protein